MHQRYLTRLECDACGWGGLIEFTSDCPTAYCPKCGTEQPSPPRGGFRKSD